MARLKVSEVEMTLLEWRCFISVFNPPKVASDGSQGVSENQNGTKFGAEDEKLSINRNDSNTWADVEEPAPAAPLAARPSPPNGGSKAWVQVLASWMMVFNVGGIMVTFGDYQTYYESRQLFTASSSNISWIGSIQSLIVFACGAVIGPVFDRGYLKTLLLTGTFGIVFGHMMLSLCDRYWQVLLAQGFVVGIGGGCLFVPSLAILPPYFSTRVGLAIGIAATGSAIGGVIYPVIFTNLISSAGFGWTVRAMGFVALGTLIIPITFAQMYAKPPGVRKIVDVSAFIDGPFMLCVFGCFLGYMGSFMGFFYTSFYAQAQHFTSPSLSLYLVPILNGMSVFGRLVPNYLADRIGPINVIGPGSALLGTVLLTNLAVHNEAGILCTAVFFGLLSGMFFATPPLLFVVLTKDKSKLGTRMGMAYAMISLAVLPGGPGSGGVLQHDKGRLDWTAAWTYAGVIPLGAFIIFIILRVWVGGSKLMTKV